MNNLVRRSQLFLKQNGATILTCVGGVGVVGTTVLAVKATPKAMRLMEEAKKEKGEELTKLEKIQVAAPVYIPAALVGASTIACIFGANVLNKRQQAGLMSAYALLDSSFKEYKDKVLELYGEEEETRVRDEIAKDNYDDNAKMSEEKQLFYDEFSSRYFETTIDRVLYAEYELNRLLSQDCGLFLNEFYDLLGIETVEYGDYVGWSSFEVVENQTYCWVEFGHRKVTMEDGLECTIITMYTEPTYEFWEY